MLYGLYTSGNGMRMQIRRQEVITNNLANSETTGFKRNLFNVKAMRPENEEIGRLGSQRNYTTDVYGGPEILSTRVSYEQGTLEDTQNELDFAINGEGFFKLKNTSTGEAFYTRSGHFTVNQDGFLADANTGLLVLDRDDNPIAINEQNGPLKDILKVVTFKNLKILHKVGDSMFSAARDTDGQMPTELPTEATVASGFLESSNTNPINEMVNMIEAHRIYQANANTLKQQDENLGSLISITRS